MSKKQHTGVNVLGANAYSRALDRAIDGVNLTELAVELTRDEGLKEPLSVAQVSEVIGCLGRRWRENPGAMVEALAISDRAGKRSAARTKNTKH